MWETLVRSLGGEDPLEKEMATHSSILAWRIPWTEEPGSLVDSLVDSLVAHGVAESGTTVRLHFLSQTEDVSLSRPNFFQAIS